jgi:hypothetical protein
VPPFAGAHRITLTGKLGGDGELTLDGNECALAENGSTNGCDKAFYAPKKVKLQEVAFKDGQPKHRLFDLVGAPQPMRLMVPGAGGPYRLLVLNEKGETTAVLTLEGKSAKQEPPGKEIALQTAYLEQLFRLAHVIRLKGKLGGDATFHPDGNSCTLDTFGDRAECTKVAFAEVKVRLEEVPLNADRVPGYKLYDIKIEGWPVDMRLMIDGRDGQPPRLLGLKDGKVVRVVTLEPMP